MISKRIGIEAVFIKTGINNKGYFDSFLNIRNIQKVPRLKLYLSRQRWTVNETVILFKILWRRDSLWCNG